MSEEFRHPPGTLGYAYDEIERQMNIVAGALKFKGAKRKRHNPLGILREICDWLAELHGVDVDDGWFLRANMIMRMKAPQKLVARAKQFNDWNSNARRVKRSRELQRRQSGIRCRIVIVREDSFGTIPGEEA